MEKMITTKDQSMRDIVAIVKKTFATFTAVSSMIPSQSAELPANSQMMKAMRLCRYSSLRVKKVKEPRPIAPKNE